jgi:hypothetical protein
VVRKCHESWVAKNPGWRIQSLDQNSLPLFASADYSAGNLSRLSRNHQSDLLRLDLLARHGGVWVDATCFCVRPLNDWLPTCTDTGFFAFNQPGPDRLMSSWFLAAEPGNMLVSRLFERMLTYWGDHRFVNDERRLLVRVLTRLLKNTSRTRGWWYSPLFRDWLGVCPYFALHYAFERLVREDPRCASIWYGTPRISADPPHSLYRAGLLSPLSPAVRAEIDGGEVPVYKTMWKLGNSEIPGDSILSYLLDNDARMKATTMREQPPRTPSS